MARRKKTVHIEAQTLKEAAELFHQTRHIMPSTSDVEEGVEKMRRKKKGEAKGKPIKVPAGGVRMNPKFKKKRKPRTGKVGTGADKYVKKNTTGLDANDFRHLDLLDS